MSKHNCEMTTPKRRHNELCLDLLGVFFALMAQIFSVVAMSKQDLDTWQVRSRPRLVVVIVVDQMRSEALLEMAKDPKQTFGKFVRSSALIPFAKYGLLQAMTCPGHATILTGADPVDSGIPLNDWYDSTKRKLVNCVEQTDGSTGPENLKVPTLSDDLKLSGKAGRVISISIKDRSAIMLAGKLGDDVFWIDTESQQKWISSPSYSRVEQNQPNSREWVRQQNRMLSNRVDRFLKTSPGQTAKDFWHTEEATEVTISMALAALEQLKVAGSASDSERNTDHLYVSFSAHDLVGHRHGPLSSELKAISESEQKAIGRLIEAIDRQVGRNNRIIVLTSDHAVAIPEEDARAVSFPAGRLKMDQLLTELNQHLKRTVKKPSPSLGWFEFHRSFNLYLNPKAREDFELRKRVLRTAQAWLEEQPGVHRAVSFEGQIEDGEIYGARLSKAIQKTFVKGRSGDLVVVPRPYWIEGKAKATHLTNYEYDRTVPILFNGALFQSGVFAQAVSINDIAPTLAFALGSPAPAASTGKVLEFLLRQQ